MSEEQRRVFFALWPGAGVQAALADWASRLQRKLHGKSPQAATIHLTLAFVGEVPVSRLPALQAIGAGQSGRAFDLAIDSVGCWPHNAVAWASPETVPAALLELYGGLAMNLRAEGFRVDTRPYLPHITLLRRATCRELDWRPSEPIRWRVERFVLVQSQISSQGSNYTEIGSWPLR
ncbi:MAG TPA: RNA 2',3'-cyclic phosphodiesterase [Burkholderiales bacterium]|nr:RNA 2',3'-cyclic phosphodiesterase [Burkholderiales bacterium]